MPNKILKTLELAGEPFDVPSGDITGVKGQQENSYRTGNVNLNIDNLVYLGANVTGGVANDTKAKWKELGTGYCLISQNNMVNGQPAQYGLLISISNGANILAQYFLVAASGVLYRRGNTAAATTAMPAFVPVNTDTNYTAGTNLTLTDGKFAIKTSPAFTGTPTAPNVADKSVKTTQIANTAFVQGAIDRRLPKDAQALYTNTTARSIPNSTYTTFNMWTADKKGVLLGFVSAAFTANATGLRGFEVLKGGSGLGAGVQMEAASTGNTGMNLAFVSDIASGDKIQLRVIQRSGGALNLVNTYLRGYIISD